MQARNRGHETQAQAAASWAIPAPMRTNGCTARARSAAAIPGPLSLTSSCTLSATRRTSTSMRPPAARYFNPFSMRLVSSCASSCRLPWTKPAASLGKLRVRAWALRYRLEEFDQLRGQLAHVHGARRGERRARLGKCNLQQRRERALQAIHFAQCGFDRFVHRRFQWRARNSSASMRVRRRCSGARRSWAVLSKVARSVPAWCSKPVETRLTATASASNSSLTPDTGSRRPMSPP